MWPCAPVDGSGRAPKVGSVGSAPWPRPNSRTNGTLPIQSESLRAVAQSGTRGSSSAAEPTPRPGEPSTTTPEARAGPGPASPQTTEP